jgi:hypothetical protein
MRYLPWLEKTVGARLADRSSIGRPVFTRMHLELSADHGLLIPIAEAALVIAGRWIGGGTGAGVRAIYALGGVKHGSVTLQVEFAQGQTALLSAEPVHPAAEAAVQVLCTGQHGTLRFEDYPDPAMLAQPIEGPKPGYRGSIERSLVSGKTVRAEEA